MGFRWTLYDPLIPETFTFAYNPNDGGIPGYAKNITHQETTAPDGRALLMEGRDPPQELSWKGVLLTQAERDNFIHWFQKRNQVQLTNDLGEQFWIYIDRFTPTRKRSGTIPAKYEYELHAFILNTGP
jgi:hypothetical protein